MHMLVVKIIILVVVILLVVLFAAFVPLGLWISALASGVKIGVGDLIGMRLRRVAPKKIVMAMVKGTKAGLNLNLNQVEAHLLAGGNVDSVVNALIAAERSNIELTFEQASAIDLAGRDVFEAVTMTVTPKVISTPSISAVAKDGIELLVTARVTVRTNIARLIGGAGRVPCLHESAKELLQRWDRRKSIRMYWRIRMRSPRWFFRRGWIRARHMKSSPLTLRILTSEETLVQI